MAVTLCVLLWPRIGREAALVNYEDQVLAFVPSHGGRMIQRARTNGSDGAPLEVQLVEFPSDEAFEGYMHDERRLRLGAARDFAIEKTQVFRVTLV